MHRLLQHRSKAEENPMLRLIHHHFLLTFPRQIPANPAVRPHITVLARLAGLEDALPRRKFPYLHLRGQHRRLIVIQQLKQRHVPQLFGIAWHGISLAFGFAAVSAHKPPHAWCACMLTLSHRFSEQLFFYFYVRIKSSTASISISKG